MTFTVCFADSLKKQHFSRRKDSLKKKTFLKIRDFGIPDVQNQNIRKYWKLLLIFHVILMFIIRLYLRNDFFYYFKLKFATMLFFQKKFFSIFCLSFLRRFIENARFMHANVQFTWTQPFRLFSQLKKQIIFSPSKYLIASLQDEKNPLVCKMEKNSPVLFKKRIKK